MTKFRWYYDSDKEMDFLNEMSRRGYALTGFFAGFYRFDQCMPGEYICQIDITEGLWHVDNSYREFMRDMDVEIISLWGPWVFLRKRAADGPFVMYTDVESRIEHYGKILTLFKTGIAIETACLLMETVAGLCGFSLGWVFCLLLAAILVGMLREAGRVHEIMEELKARAEGLPKPESRGKRRLSGLLIAGCLLSMAALLIPVTEVSGGIAFLWGFLKGFCTVTGVLFLVLGCVLSLRKREG